MTYQEILQGLGNQAEQIETTYQQAVRAGHGDEFAAAIESQFGDDRDNLLYAAWHYRLLQAASSARKRVIAWGWALPLAVLNGLLLWLLSDDQRFTVSVTNPLTGQAHNILPVVALLAAPISAALVILFLTGAGNRLWSRSLVIVLSLGAAVACVFAFFPQIWPSVFQEQYLSLAVLHLLLLAWAAVGIAALFTGLDAENRFAFLVKSLETFVVAGLFAIAGGLFTAITFGLFDALGIQMPDVIQRLFLAGGAGAVIVLAVALVYDPTVEPVQQSFDEGLSRLVALLLRLLLPLATLVLLVYLAFIPFNFREPFENRDVLIIFNAMLFAVMALLVGATPVRETDLDPRMQTWLRRGVIALAALALLVGIYALAAILYRTGIDRPTPNRLTFIGWNVINIGVLAVLLIRQWQAGRAGWLPALHETFAGATTTYFIWAVVVILALPWAFQGSVQDVAGLPQRIQWIAYDEPYPILLKCGGSPQIYLLEEGAKHWIKDIPTFEAKGFQWSDVRFVSCDDLSAVPNGVPIPPDAGPPPAP